MRGHDITPEQIARIRHLAKQRLPTKIIAERMGLSPKRVREHIRQGQANA